MADDVVELVSRVPLPTPLGRFEVHAFEGARGAVHLAVVHGDVAGREDVLTRVHSECLTGDVLGSLRCDCGVQLRQSLSRVAAEPAGIVVYVTGHEGRGIGLVNKLRAYLRQDEGDDTVDANLHLGLPVDARDYGDTAAVLAHLGVASIRLLTNNPTKVAALRAAGTVVSDVVGLATAPHPRNRRYLATKEHRLGHVRPSGTAAASGASATGGPAPVAATVPVVPVVPSRNGHAPALDPAPLMGASRPRADRPHVVVKYAQTLDGRIATSTGDSRWISGEPERAVAHAMRAASDGVLVGIGTVVVDDPQLTVRLVAGASPRRVVLDSQLRVPDGARILAADAATTIVTTERSDPARRAGLRERGVSVEVVAADGDGRVDVRAALRALRAHGMETVLVEGGGGVITALLRAGLVDRLVVAVAPIVVGSGTDAVGPLGVTTIADGIRLVDRSVHTVGDDVLLAWDVAAPAP